jgi:hypothetical protein
MPAFLPAGKKAGPLLLLFSTHPPSVGLCSAPCAMELLED